MVPLPSRAAGEELAAENAEPVLRPNEFLARASGAGAAGLVFLDLAPVVIVGRHHPAALEQLLQPFGAGAITGGSGGHGGGDLVGDFVAVRTVGADGARRTTPRPADGIQPIGNAAAIVDELAAFERHVRD